MRLAPVLRGLVAGVWFWPLAATAAPLGVSVKADGPNDFTITVAIDAERLPVTHASAFGLTFTQIRAGDPKAIRQPGLPDLPEFHRLVAVDPTQKYEVQTTLEGKVVYDNVLLMPEQEDTPDNGTKAAFRLDSESYKIDRELGSVTVLVGALAHIGPISVMPLTLTPFHYNPAKRQLTVWRHVTAHVSTKNKAPARFVGGTVKITPYQSAQILELVENGKQVLADVPLVDMPRLLVVTTSDLLAKAHELTAGGRMPQYAFEFATVDQLRDSASIQSLIAQNYARGGLDSVLFFGDEQKIPLYFWTSAMPGDYFYQLVDGADNYSDVGLGRLPVSNENEANIVLAKLARYDQLQRSGAGNKRVLLVAHKEDYPGKYTANQEGIRTAANPRGLTFVTEYGGATATNQNVLDEAARGYALIDYRGHGDDTSWYLWGKDGLGFGAPQVDALSNGNEGLSVFFNIACDTGAIHEDAPTMAENLLYHTAADGSGRGAVAVLASTIDSFTDMNHTFNTYLFNALQGDAAADLGTIIGVANNRLVRDGAGQIPPNVKM